MLIERKLKGSQAWQCTAVVPATQEAEVERSLEPSSSRPTWATQKDPISEIMK
jgi:hypothetical protein